MWWSVTDKGGRQRALVVNDTQEILELFDEILQGMDFEVILMSYAPRELDRIREVKPDLIVLDFLMGDREPLGWQLLQKLKMDRRLDAIPVIVCTAAVKAVEEQQGYLTEQGVVVVLKPFNVDQLEDAVRRVTTMSPTARDVVKGADRTEKRPGGGSQRSASSVTFTGGPTTSSVLVFTVWIRSPAHGQNGVVRTILISVGASPSPMSTALMRSRSTMLIPISGS